MHVEMLRQCASFAFGFVLSLIRSRCTRMVFPTNRKGPIGLMWLLSRLAKRSRFLPGHGLNRSRSSVGRVYIAFILGACIMIFDMEIRTANVRARAVIKTVCGLPLYSG